MPQNPSAFLDAQTKTADDFPQILRDPAHPAVRFAQLHQGAGRRIYAAITQKEAAMPRLPTYFISHGGGPWPWLPKATGSDASDRSVQPKQDVNWISSR